jgi:hypothetical protein
MSKRGNGGGHAQSLRSAGQLKQSKQPVGGLCRASQGGIT